MKLLAKITGIIILGTIILLAIDGFLSVRRETDLFDKDMARDGLVLARAMRDLVAITWETSGEQRALDLISEANRNEREIEIRWVWLDAAEGSPFAPKLSREEWHFVAERKEFSYKQTRKGGAGYHLTYVTVPVDGGRVGALEIADPLVTLRMYTRNNIVRTSLLTLGMAALSAIVLWVVGLRLVGRPLDQLVEKTRRVGAGDFSEDLAMPGREELSNLANALNEMCHQLESARNALIRETETRINALEQLRHAERLATVGRLSSGIAHELGTPLNVVAGRANIIASEELDRGEIVSFSRTIVEQANRMTGIIRQLLDFARRRPTERAPVDMTELCEEVIDFLGGTARKSNVQLTVESSAGLPAANADRAQMQQVLMNLTMNGIQAMPRGGRLALALGVERARHPGDSGAAERECLFVRVTDEGVGIPKDQLGLVFDPFFTTKEVGKGTGLGLSISYGIVEEHGGWIAVHSTPGKGSVFTIYLPLEET